MSRISSTSTPCLRMIAGAGVDQPLGVARLRAALEGAVDEGGLEAGEVVVGRARSWVSPVSGRWVVQSSSASCSTQSRAGPSVANSSAMAASSWSRWVTLMPRGAAQLGVRRPVGVGQRGVPDRVVGGELLLADLAERVVVEQHVLDRDAVLDGGGQLHGVLAEAAVAGHRDDRAGRGRRPRRPSRPGSRSRSSRGSPTSAPAAPSTRGSGRASRRGCRRRRRRRRPRAGARTARRTRRPPRRRGPRSSAARRAFSARQIAQRSATSARWSSASAAGRRTAAASAGTTSAASPSRSAVTASNRPIAVGVSSTCTIGLHGAMPVWLENDAPTTSSRSASFISQLATGVPLRPSTPAPSGCVSGHQPLGLERREHRRARAARPARSTSSRAPRAP